jgi:hypothetical protein
MGKTEPTEKGIKKQMLYAKELLAGHYSDDEIMNKLIEGGYCNTRESAAHTLAKMKQNI